MKNKIMLILLASFFTFIGNADLNAQGCNCFPGWMYRLTITISNNNSGAYTNFEVRDSINTQALISAGKMKTDGADIRFSDTLCNPLNYFIESGINTPGTIIWVKVSNLPANGSRTVYMYYGNPAAAAQTSGPNTFSFYEGFDNNTLGRLSMVCSSGTPNVSFSSGLATFSWTASAMWLSDSSFAFTDVYTGEANVTAASGNWPGVYWARSIGTQSMAVLMGVNSVRVSKTPLIGTNFCYGHNFVAPTYPVTNPVGIWGFTWIATGSQAASFPGVGAWSTADAELAKDQPLRLGLGGISSGTGSYTIDWVRARKYAPNKPMAVNGSEASVPNSPGNSCTATALSSSSIRVNWADSSNNEDKFRIERSTNGGVNWSLRDSVPANTTQYTDNGLSPNTQYCYRVHALNCIGASANSNMACSTTSPLGVVKSENEIPKVFNLYQNFPNPFNPVTNIKFDIPKASGVKLVIYDAIGREVIVLVNRQLNAGAYKVDWDASGYSSGIYFYRIVAGDYINEMKMVVLK